MHDGMIYFIEQPDCGAVKIGYTRDMMTRVRNIATFCPLRLQLIGLIAGTTADEEALHRRFAEHRNHGEWFRRCPEIDAAMLAPVTDHTRMMLESFRGWSGLAGIRGFELSKKAGRPVGSKDSYKRTRKAKSRYETIMEGVRAEFPERFLTPS